MSLVLPPSFTDADRQLVAAIQAYDGALPPDGIVDGVIIITSVSDLDASGRHWALVDRMPDTPLSMKLGNLQLMALEMVAKSPGAVSRISPRHIVRRDSSDPIEPF